MGNTIVFFAIYKNKPIAFTSLTKYNTPYVMIENAFTAKEWQNTGVMTGLYHFIVRNQKLKILSGFEQTQEAERLLQSLINRNILNISIADIKADDKIYTLDQAGVAKTEDGEIVLNPKDDRSEDRTKQRFFYLAEANMQFTESGHNVVGTLIKSKMLGNSIVTEESLKLRATKFGPPDP